MQKGKGKSRRKFIPPWTRAAMDGERDELAEQLWSYAEDALDCTERPREYSYSERVQKIWSGGRFARQKPIPTEGSERVCEVKKGKAKAGTKVKDD